MAKAIFSVFFKIIKGIVSVLLSPVNLLVTNLFPDFTNLINTFNNAVTTYIGAPLGYFFNILPPNCRTAIILYLSILITYYTTSLTIHAILKIYKLIKNIKFW